jgi:hypothetical protein
MLESVKFDLISDQDIEFTLDKKVQRGLFSSAVAIRVHKNKISRPLNDIGRITGAEQMPRSTNYQEILFKYLKDSEQAVAYLNAAIEEGDPNLFLLALKNVAEAQGSDLTNFSQAPPSLELQTILQLLYDAGLVFTLREDRKAS